MLDLLPSICYIIGAISLVIWNCITLLEAIIIPYTSNQKLKKSLNIVACITAFIWTTMAIILITIYINKEWFK